MGLQRVEEFFAKVFDDEQLQKEYWTALGNATRQAVVRLAQSQGFDFSEDDLRQVWLTRSSELSEDQLEAVAGGLGGHSLRAVELSNQLVDLVGEVGFFALGGRVTALGDRLAGMPKP